MKQLSLLDGIIIAAVCMITLLASILFPLISDKENTNTTVPATINATLDDSDLSIETKSIPGFTSYLYIITDNRRGITCYLMNDNMSCVIRDYGD